MAADLLRAVLEAALASGAAVLVTLVLRKSMRRRFGARVAYALWSVVPLSTLALLLPAPSTPTAHAAAAASAPTGGIALIAVDAWQATARADGLAWFGGLWIAGGIAMLLVFAWQQRRFERGLGRLSPLGRGLLKAQATAGVPALVGAWHPRIVLPADFEQRYSVVERELILAHERMHRQRGDAQVNALAAALRCRSAATGSRSIRWWNASHRSRVRCRDAVVRGSAPSRQAR